MTHKKLMLILPKIGEINISIKDKKLLEFTNRQLKNYIDTESSDDSYDSFVQISATCLNNLNLNNLVLGRQIKFKDNKLSFRKDSRVQSLEYKYNFKDSLKLDINFSKNLLYLLKQVTNSNYSLTHSLFYQTILYPIFSLYAIVDNYFLVHGSLLKLEDKYIVLTGLDGVGKSSLSNELVNNGASILADNFVLFNGNKFLGLNMPIRLDLENNTDENIIFQDDNLKEVLYDYKEDESVEVNSIYFLSISEKLAIKKLDQNIMQQNWNFINNGADEILGANLFNVPFLYQNSLNNNIQNNSFDYYSFEIPKGNIKEATKELICQLNI